jgi:hypothetical protein
MYIDVAVLTVMGHPIPLFLSKLPQPNAGDHPSLLKSIKNFSHIISTMRGMIEVLKSGK